MNLVLSGETKIATETLGFGMKRVELVLLGQQFLRVASLELRGLMRVLLPQFLHLPIPFARESVAG